jgi:hypothetical protein
MPVRHTTDRKPSLTECTQSNSTGGKDIAASGIGGGNAHQNPRGTSMARNGGIVLTILDLFTRRSPADIGSVL